MAAVVAITTTGVFAEPESTGSAFSAAPTPTDSATGSPPPDSATGSPPAGTAGGSSSPVVPSRTYTQTVSTPPGARTYTDPYNLIGEGSRIDNGRNVQVSCTITAPSAPSVGLYWYQIASPPWGNQYYSPANAFLNGDPPEGPGTTVVDETVPDCPR